MGRMCCIHETLTLFVTYRDFHEVLYVKKCNFQKLFHVMLLARIHHKNAFSLSF
jgi:hypothetical protein